MRGTTVSLAIPFTRPGEFLDVKGRASKRVRAELTLFSKAKSVPRSEGVPHGGRAAGHHVREPHPRPVHRHEEVIATTPVLTVTPVDDLPPRALYPRKAATICQTRKPV